MWYTIVVVVILVAMTFGFFSSLSMDKHLEEVEREHSE